MVEFPLVARRIDRKGLRRRFKENYLRSRGSRTLNLRHQSVSEPENYVGN
jgi:hypothetical protein